MRTDWRTHVHRVIMAFQFEIYSVRTTPTNQFQELHTCMFVQQGTGWHCDEMDGQPSQTKSDHQRRGKLHSWCWFCHYQSIHWAWTGRSFVNACLLAGLQQIWFSAHKTCRANGNCNLRSAEWLHYGRWKNGGLWWHTNNNRRTQTITNNPHRKEKPTLFTGSL